MNAERAIKYVGTVPQYFGRVLGMTVYKDAVLLACELGAMICTRQPGSDADANWVLEPLAPMPLPMSPVGQGPP